MSSNFDFLEAEWSFLQASAKEAEKHAITAPVTSAFYWINGTFRGMRKFYITTAKNFSKLFLF